MIRAYPSRVCVRAGERLRLHVDADVQHYGVSFVRCGGSPLRIPGDGGMHTGKIYSFLVPPEWPGGAYVAVLDANDALPAGSIDARYGRALFTVIRTDSRAPLLVVLPLFTYHAYNVADVDGTLRESEGECLYSGAPWVSLDRPGGGTGGHPWDEVNADVYDMDTPRQTFAHWDAKGLAWLEREALTYDCVTDLELHDGSIDLARYRAVASFGHHEYWTREMRDRTESYVRSGGNVAFFGGNTCWFRAQYDAATNAIRRAGRWSGDPEWKFTGVTYACGGGKWIGERPACGYRVADASHWIYAQTGVQHAEEFGAQARLIGYEFDGAPPQSDIEVLADARVDWPVSDGSGELAKEARATLGIRSAGGSVFTASTVDWARVLESGDPIAGAITRNVLRRFIAGG